MDKVSKIFGPRQSGERLDIVLARWFTSLSRTEIQKKIENGDIVVNGRSKKPSYLVKVGDHLLMDRSGPKKESQPVPQDISLDVIHEDGQLIAVNKSYGMVVHPGPGHPDGTLVNALLGRSVDLPDSGRPKRPGIVHRLDKDTTGVIVVAKTEGAYRDLVDQFKNREVKKEYIALTTGTFEEDSGTIDAPVGRSRRHRTRMKVTLDGKEAVTNFEVAENFESLSLVYVYPKTGRTHQIRVHFKYIGHPLVGDDRYGGKEGDKLMLHARKLTVTHPGTGEDITFETEVPDRFRHYFSD